MPVPVVTGIIVGQVSVGDIIAVSESVRDSVHAAVNTAVADVLTLADSVQDSVHISINTAVADVFSLADSVRDSVHISINTAVADVHKLNEFVVSSAGFGTTDWAHFIDSFRTSIAMKSAQVFSIGDTLTAGLAASRSDPVGLAESVAFLVQRPLIGGTSVGTGAASGPSGAGAGSGIALPPVEFAGNLDGDQISSEIDGRFVNGRFIDQRNAFSSEFTDQHLAGLTFGTISARGGLSLAITDADDPDTGLRASVSGRGGTAIVALCADQFRLNLTAGDSVLMTCGSLTVAVLTGDVEVDLGPMLAVTLGRGATAKVTHLGNGRFAAENSGASGLVTTIASGNIIEIAPGDRVELGNLPEARLLFTPEAPFGLPADLDGVALDPSSTASAEPITPPSLTPTSPGTPLPQPTSRPEPLEGPLPFPPLPDDAQTLEISGAIALGTIVGAALIAVVVSLIGLVRSRASRAAPKTIIDA